MGLPAQDENKKCIVGVLGFFSLSWAGQQNANEFSEISPGTRVTVSGYHAIFRGKEVASHFPQFFAVT